MIIFGPLWFVIIGLLVYWFVRPWFTKATKVTKTYRCTSCNATFPGDAAFCPSCGVKFVNSAEKALLQERAVKAAQDSKAAALEYEKAAKAAAAAEAETESLRLRLDAWRRGEPLTEADRLEFDEGASRLLEEAKSQILVGTSDSFGEPSPEWLEIARGNSEALEKMLSSPKNLSIKHGNDLVVAKAAEKRMEASGSDELRMPRSVLPDRNHGSS